MWRHIWCNHDMHVWNLIDTMFHIWWSLVKKKSYSINYGMFWCFDTVFFFRYTEFAQYRQQATGAYNNRLQHTIISHRWKWMTLHSIHPYLLIHSYFNWKNKDCNLAMSSYSVLRYRINRSMSNCLVISLYFQILTGKMPVWFPKKCTMIETP